MTTQEVTALEARLTWTRMPAGTQLIEAGSCDTSVYLLAEGRARIARFSEAGREITFTDVAAPCFIGDLSAMTGALRSVDVTLLSPARYAQMTTAGFSNLLQSTPALAMGHIRVMSVLVWVSPTASSLRLPSRCMTGLFWNSSRWQVTPASSQGAAPSSTLRPHTTR